MTLAREVLFRNDMLEVRRVVCRPQRPEPGDVEAGGGLTLVLPTAGLFRLHRGRHDDFVADPTQAILLPAGELHRYSHPHAGGDVCLAIELREPAAATALAELAPAVADGARRLRIGRVFVPPALLRARALLADRLAGRVAGNLECEEVATSVLATALPASAGGSPPTAPETARRRRARVEAVQLALSADPGRPWRLQELAALAATGACHLCTVFRQETGLPIHRYLLRLRLERALGEVLASERELTTIALDLGFSTPSHFTASFRRVFGTTPSALRQQRRRKISTAPPA